MTLSSGKDGLLLYELRIAGIDTAEIRSEVLKVFEEKRFFLSTKDINESIKDGELLLSELSPVKTVILVQRLKSLPLNIQWRQNALINEN